MATSNLFRWAMPRLGIGHLIVPPGGGQSVRLLTDYIEPADFPIYHLLPLGDLSLIDQLYVGRAWTSYQNDVFVLSADFHFNHLMTLSLPGFSQIQLQIGGGKPAQGIVRVGEHSSVRLENLGIGLKFDETLLLDVRTNSGAELTSVGSLVIDETGFRITGFQEFNLDWAKVAETELLIKLDGIVLGNQGLGLAIKAATLRIPDHWGNTQSGAFIEFSANDLVFERNGLSGWFRHSGGVIDTTLFGMKFKLRDASIELDDGRLGEAYLSGSIDVSKFATGGGSKWLEADLRIGVGGITASLRASADSDDAGEEPSAGGESEEEEETVSAKTLATFSFEKLLEFNVRALRLEVSRDAKESTLWLTGAMHPLFDEDWPDLEFDELGIDNHGTLKLAEGASVATTAPFSVEWEIAQLTVTAFSLERPREAPDALEMRISAGVKLIDAIPAGASVDGLVLRWTPGGHDLSVRFDGIGVKFGVPGAFNVAACFSYEKKVGFSGDGHLSVEALDLTLDVLLDVRKAPRGFNTFFLAAEAQVFPGGIPIGATALSLYGVSGLLAYNLALDVNTAVPLKPRRYYDLFIEHDEEAGLPIGFATPKKWLADEGASALGLGVVVGTSDDGWMLSGRGALIVALPDVSLFLTATADLVSQRQGMDATGEGSLAALLAILPGENLMRLDFSANWTMEPLYAVSANGGGEFHFDDPTALKVFLGQAPERGTPVEAKLLKLGDHWLFSAGYWFEFDSFRRVDVGGYSPIELRVGTSSIYAEFVGSGRADLRLAYAPTELSGKANVQGHARLAACGLSLTFSVAAKVAVEIDEPLKVELGLRQCIEINLVVNTIEICLAYSFTWDDGEKPKPPLLPVEVSFTPRQWVPRAGRAGPTVDNGVVARTVSASGTHKLPPVYPQSAITLGFAGSMTIDPALTARVNFGTVKHPAGDPISDVMSYLSRRRLVNLDLIDLTGGTSRTLWGSFMRSPTEREDVAGRIGGGRPLQSLIGLWSSKRFSDDGSNSGGGVEDTPPIDCQPQSATIERCIRLAGLEPGESGALANGWPYRWDGGLNAHDPWLVSQIGADIRYGEELIIWAPEGMAEAQAGWIQPGEKEQPPNTWQIVEVSIHAGGDGTLRVRASGEQIFVRVCWRESKPGAPDHSYDDVLNGVPTEEWTTAAEDRVLQPGHSYRLVARVRSEIENGHATIDDDDFSHALEFDVLPPPLWPDALSRAVVATYPADGARPAYRDYDLIVQFEEDWVEAVYRLAGRELCVRLLNANGVAVKDQNGNIALLPVQWQSGPRGGSDSNRYWREGRMNGPCEPSPTPSDPVVVFPIALKALKLTPLTPYTAELVAPLAAERTTLAGDALARWTFTTSRYASVIDHLSEPVAVPEPRCFVQVAPAASNSFDDLVRSFGAPSVLATDGLRIDLVLSNDTIAFLLIESPEPLDDGLERLTVALDQVRQERVFNVDRTRAVVVLSPKQAIDALGDSLAVVLEWNDNPARDWPASSRSVEGASIARPCTWTIPLDVLS